MLKPMEGAMRKPARTATPPPDDAERRRALDPERSFLVQAPAGSGKTYLLTQRFLRLLAKAERPDEIVAITFTNAAAAEMRNRILDALEAAERYDGGAGDDNDPMSVASLAKQALEHARAMGWQLLDQPGQLRITTIDAFCRGLALQNPLSWGLLAGLGGTLETADKPQELYRRAARRTLDWVGNQVGGISPVRASIEALLLWRDNNWKDVEALIVSMLAQRNRWNQEFVLAREVDWEALRRKLEEPLCRACHGRLGRLSGLLDRLPGSHLGLHKLAQAACEAPGERSPLSVAERAELPVVLAEAAMLAVEELEDAASAWRDVAAFLLTTEGTWRKPGGLNKTMGFPSGAEGKALKQRAGELLTALAEVAGLEEALGAFLEPTPTGYTDAEWEIIRHCFSVLRVAAAELQLVFAESGVVDFVEVAQIALRVLAPVEGYPSDFALRQADQIRHLLIDEFQDTSRNQHELLGRLIAAWPEREGRSCFCVGDPMQSIYGFREAEVELFERLKSHGLDLPGEAEPFRFEFVALRANFRTVPSLVRDLNGHFGRIFPEGESADGVRFAAAEPVRPAVSESKAELHLAFARSTRTKASDGFPSGDREQTRQAQLDEMVALIQERLNSAALRSHEGDKKYRIAVLGRKRDNLIRVAEALQAAGIRYRAIELVPLRERAEILDALALTRALLNPADRRAWLGVLRAPWCGLSLEDLHRLTSADDAAITSLAVPMLLNGRLDELRQAGAISPAGYRAANRVGRVMREAVQRRPEAAVFALGTWLESVWKALGGEATVNEEQHANLRLLWAALDRLPAGEADLLGPALDAALEGLFALPDPAASSDFGVQLMTIHKSKGLEFEVVIVPELELAGRQGEKTMISWLERGLEGGEPASEPTEFLIAPIQARGQEAGAAKQWVDGVKRERELSEMRRLLYVAATRAREELHLFARPSFNVSKATGMPVLDTPVKAALLSTAWPALKETVEERFADWLGEIEIYIEDALRPAAETVPALAASAANEQTATTSNVVMMPAPWQATRVRRLPENFAGPAMLRSAGRAERNSGAAEQDTEQRIQEKGYERNIGGLAARLEGTAIHAYLERLSLLRQRWDEAEAEKKLGDGLGSVAASLRARGLSAAEAATTAHDALGVVRGILADPVGAWIVKPHAEAAAESRWTGMVQAAGRQAAGRGGTALRSLRPDRVFFAPPHTADGPAVWWIVDYKTSHLLLTEEDAKRKFLEEHRLLYAGQLESYAQLLRGMRGTVEIRAGIFYPRLLLFDHWVVNPG